MKHKCHKHPPFWGEKEPGWSHDRYPCQCDCEPCQEFNRLDALPEIENAELNMIENWLDNVTPGPWKETQCPGFGGMNFLMTLSDNSQARWVKVVAILENAGGDTGQFMAWCRDGVPRLIRKIRDLEEEVDELGNENDDLQKEIDRLTKRYT